MNEGIDEEAPTCNSGGVSCASETDERASSVSFFFDPVTAYLSHTGILLSHL